MIGENKINVAELMKCVRDLCGGLMACRYTGLNKYELTMNHPRGEGETAGRIQNWTDEGAGA